ncbi:MAG: T9SS type A sorting domain-containing protein [Bacteroidota bacterium]
MKKQNIYIITLFLFFICGNANAQTPCNGNNLYEEQDGLLVIEMETGILSEQWQTGNTEPNYTGDGYIYWSGSQFFGETGKGPVEYPIKINTPGTYKFTWRMAVGLGTQVSEHNDTWLKIDADDFYGEKATGHLVKPRPQCESDPNADCPQGTSKNGFFKVYGQSTDFIWASYTSDHDAHAIFATFDEPGEHLITINARSSWCLLDRMVLQLVGTVGNSTAQNLNTPPSDCTENTTNTKELENEVKFNLFPNPIQDQLNIQTEAYAEANFSIFDLNGKILCGGPINGQSTDVDVTNFQQGIYIFQITHKNKTQVKRFVKL